MFMNDYAIDRARVMATRNRWTNRAKLVKAVNALREWADDNSDGWAYWPKPVRAAKRAMEVIEGDGTNRADATEAEVKAALVPIRSFLTRQGVDAASVLGF